MSSKSTSVLLRADRVLVAALSVVLATASAAIGAAAVYSPHTEEIRVTRVIEPVVQTIVANVAAPISPRSRTDVVLGQLLAR